MKWRIDLSKAKSRVSHLAGVVAAVRAPLMRVLTFSLGDKAIWPERTLAVCLESDRLTVAAGRRFFSRIRISGARAFPYEREKYPQPEAMASNVELALNELKAPVDAVTLSIPKSWVIMRTVELPVTVKENLPAVVAFELDRFTPFVAEESFYDYRIVGESGGMVKVLVGACRAEVVTPLIRALAQKQIAVTRITTGLSAMSTSCSFHGRADFAAFVNVLTDSYEGTLMTDGTVVGVCGGTFDTGLESSVEGVSAGIVRMRESVAPDAGSPSMLVYVAGEGVGSETRKLEEKIPSAKVLVCPGGGGLCLPAVEEGRVSPVVAGAILESLWVKAKGLNLLAKGLRKDERTPLTATMFLLAVIAAMAVVYAATPLQIERKRVEEIGKQLAALTPEVRKVEALKKEVSTLEKEVAAINSFKTDRVMTLALMKELTTVVPKQAWLTRTKIGETSVDLEGYAGSAAELLGKLETSKYLAKGEFVSQPFKDARLNMDRFVIRMNIKAFKKEQKPESDDDDE